MASENLSNGPVRDAQHGADSWLRRVLFGLLSFLSFTAICGGVALMASFYAPPVELLRGSPFSSFTLPGLALAGGVGGGAGFTAYLWWRRSAYAALATTAIGLMLMIFELVQILTIGSPPGPAQIMQLFYVGLGVLLIALSALATRPR